MTAPFVMCRPSPGVRDLPCVATDGSSADEIAGAALVLAETDATFAWGVAGQDQSSFRAEAEAILLVLRAARQVLQAVSDCRCKCLWIVSDSEAAIWRRFQLLRPAMVPAFFWLAGSMVP